MFKGSLVVLLVVALCAGVATAANDFAAGIRGISASVTYRQLDNGTWEYGYDLFGVARNQVLGSVYYDYVALLMDFGDGGTAEDHVLNMYDPGGGQAKELRDFWTVNGNSGNKGGSAHYGPVTTGVQASYGDMANDSWVLDPSINFNMSEGWGYDPAYVASGHGIVNPYHLPSDYGVWVQNDPYGDPDNDVAFGMHPGKQGDETGMHWFGYVADDDDLVFDMDEALGGHVYAVGQDPQLLATIRIVSDLGPYGEVGVRYFTVNIEVLPLVGPGVPEPASMLLIATGAITLLRRRPQR